MTAIAGLDLNSLANSLLGRSQSNNSAEHSRARGREGHPGLGENGRGDRVDLSREARDLIQSIREGVASRQSTELNFTFERLRAIQEQISFTAALTGAASGDQSDVIFGQLDDILDDLGEVSKQIAQLSVSRSQTTQEQFSFSFSASFNAQAQGENGSVSVAQSLNVEFSFLRTTQTEEHIEVSTGDDGSLTIERSFESQESIEVSISIEREQSLVVERGEADDGDVGSLAASLQQSILQQLQGAFSSNFNVESQGPGGSVSFAESLNIEFSFLRQTESRESLRISAGDDDDGVVIEHAREQAEIIETNLSIQREQTLVVESAGGGIAPAEGAAPPVETSSVDPVADPAAVPVEGQAEEPVTGLDDLRALADELRNTLQQFSALLESAQDRFGGQGSLTEQLVSLIGDLLNIQGDDDTDDSPFLIDTAA